MPTVTKNKATETRPAGAKNTATASKTVKSPKDARNPVEPIKRTSKAEATTPGKAKASTKTETKKAKKSTEYTPNTNSMRHFIYQALKRGGSAKKIKTRAAQLAEKAGIKKYATPEAYKGFDVAFFVGMLKERGVKIDEDGNKYKLAA